MTPTQSTNLIETLKIYVLCAEWCGVCRNYQSFVDEQRQKSEHSWVWIDVEDHADLLANLDIENFPSLLVVQGDSLLFLGTVLPQADVAIRLIQSLVNGNRYALPHLDHRDELIRALHKLSSQTL